MAIRVGTEQIRRERGYLYYIALDGRVWRTPTQLNVGGTKKPVSRERYRRVDGWMYFLDKSGFVSVARMKGTPGPNPPPERFRRHSAAEEDREARREVLRE